MKVHEMSRNAYIIDNFETGEVVLQSYDSIVAIFEKESEIVTLGRNWNFSITTIKHVCRFLEEYKPSALCDSRTKKRSIESLIQNGHILYDPELI